MTVGFSRSCGQVSWWIREIAMTHPGWRTAIISGYLILLVSLGLGFASKAGNATAPVPLTPDTADIGPEPGDRSIPVATMRLPTTLPILSATLTPPLTPTLRDTPDAPLGETPSPTVEKAPLPEDDLSQTGLPGNGSNCATADVNGDGAINVLDVAAIGLQFGNAGTPGWLPEDVLPDGAISVLDLLAIEPCLRLATSDSTASSYTLRTSDAQTIVAITPQAESVSVGSIVTAEVTISTTLPTRGMAFGLTFDPTVLRCEGVDQGAFYRDWAESHGATVSVYPIAICNNATGSVSDMGVVVLGGGTTGGPTGKGVVATYRFTALAPGNSPLTLVHVEVSDDHAASPRALAIEVRSSSVQVTARAQTSVYLPLVLNAAEAQGTPTATPTPSSTPTATRTPNNTPTATATVSGSNAGRLSVVPPRDSIGVGQQFDVNINLELNPTSPSRGLTLAIEFDPLVLKCLSVTEGDFYRSWATSHQGQTQLFPAPAINNVTGKVSATVIVMAPQEVVGGPTGSGTVFVVRFQALSQGTSPLRLVDVEVSNADTDRAQALQVSKTDSQVTVAGTAATSTPTSTPTATPTPTSTTSATGTVTQTPTATATTLGALQTRTVNTATPWPTIAANAVLRVEPASITIEAGAAFTISVQLDTDKPSRGAQAGITFDPAVLQCDKVEEGTFFSAWAQSKGGSTSVFPSPACDNSAGKVSSGAVIILGGVTGPMAAAGGPTGSGSVFIVHFKAKTRGSSPLTLVDTEVSSDDLAHPRRLALTVRNGTVTVGAATATPGPTPGSNATPQENVATAMGSGAAGSDAAVATSSDSTFVDGGTGGGMTGSGAHVSDGAPAAGGGQVPGEMTTTGDTPSGSGAQSVPGGQGGGNRAPLAGAGTACPDGSGKVDATYNPCLPDVTLSYDLSAYVDDNGIFNSDVEVQAPDGLSALRIRRDTQALTADNFPLRGVSVCVLEQVPAIDSARMLVTTAYQLSPEGATFDPPATIIIAYDPAKLPPGVKDSDLKVATFNYDTYEWLELKSQVMISNATVAAKHGHFSVYAVVAKRPVRNWRPLIIGSSIVELLIGAAAVFYLRRRRTPKNQPKETQS